MKRIINVLIAAFVLTLVTATYACAQWELQGKYSEGLAIVVDSNGKYGFIDEDGKVVVPCKWELASDFSEGQATVTDANGKWCTIDKTGKIK